MGSTRYSRVWTQIDDQETKAFKLALTVQVFPDETLEEMDVSVIDWNLTVPFDPDRGQLT